MIQYFNCTAFQIDNLLNICMLKQKDKIESLAIQFKFGAFIFPFHWSVDSFSKRRRDVTTTTPTLDVVFIHHTDLSNRFCYIWQLTGKSVALQYPVSMALNKKIEEGMDYIKAAEKSLKTSLLKWRPDYDSAADEYTKAATAFKNGKSFEQSRECLMRAADCHKQNRALFHAAKSIDQAVLLCKDLGDLRDVAQLAERACNLYQQHGSPDSGAASLDKAAKLLEKEYPEHALRLYQRAADVVMLEDSPRQAAEFMSKVARIMVKLQMYDQAADALRREIGLHQDSEHLQAVGRLAVALVLVQLARGDYVAGEKAFKEWGNYCDAPEVQTLEMLLQGFDDEDPDTIRSALSSPFIKHMDVEYARLARDLPIPQGIGNAPKPAVVREGAAPYYVSPNAGEDDKPGEAGSDDEFGGGLC